MRRVLSRAIRPARALLIIAAGLTIALVAAEEALRRFPGWTRGSAAHPPGIREVRRSVEFTYEFRTNDLGLRERPVANQAPAGVRRVLVLGDSFVEGFGVAAADRFTDRLQARLERSDPPTELINAGITGAGPLQYGRLLEEVGLPLRPDEVLVCLYANDVTNTPDHVDPPHWDAPPRRTAMRPLPYLVRLIRRAIPSGRHGANAPGDLVGAVRREAIRRRVPSDRIDEWTVRVPPELVRAADRGEFNGRILSSGLLQPTYWTDAIDVDSDRARRQWASAHRILDRIHDLCGGHGIRVRVAFLPSPHLHDETFHAPDHPGVRSGTVVRGRWLRETTPIQTLVAGWAAKHGLPFLDLTPAFRAATAAGRSTNFPLDGHWNPEGHALVADALAEWWVSPFVARERHEP